MLHLKCVVWHDRWNCGLVVQRQRGIRNDVLWLQTCKGGRSTSVINRPDMHIRHERLNFAPSDAIARHKQERQWILK